jgi:hypothetical protein
VTTDLQDIEARKAWSRAYIRRAPDGPVFGSAEWLGLAEGPAKWAAVVRAAEAWLTEAEEHLAQLDAELRFRALEVKRTEDAAYRARREAHRKSWTGRGFRLDPFIEADVERDWADWVNDDGAA